MRKLAADPAVAIIDLCPLDHVLGINAETTEGYIHKITFSPRALRSEVRSTDGWDYDIDFSQPITEHIEQATEIFDDPTVLDQFNVFPLKGKVAISYSHYATVLVLRTLSTYIRRRFDVGLQTREDITKGLIQALGDATPIHVVRRDIRSFYENVPTEALVEDLLYTTALPAKARRLLERFFELHCSGTCGLPRGLGISATLAELALQKFDASIRRLPGVYRYHRFVDDMILLCNDPRGVSTALEQMLPAPMKLHPRKRFDVDISASSVVRTDFAEFEYLGYQYKVQLNPKRGEARQVDVGVAQAKVDKMLTRMITASRAYYMNENFPLFQRRIQFLTGNYRFVKKRPLSTTGSSTVRSGIFYNYKLCGIYCGNQFVTSRMPELRKLDWFLQNSILGSRHFLGRNLRLRLSAVQMESLRKLSFTQGHLRAFNVSLTSSQVDEIKGIWKNV
jgi:hypothetical protein